MSLPPSVIHDLVRGLHIATIARYLSLSGLVALLYDHVLTFDQEIQLVWKAPSSFVKWIFLANRYLSEVCLLAVANEMSGFNNHTYNNQNCRTLIITVASCSVISTLTSNVVIFLRVIVLWDKSPRVVFYLFSVLVLSFLATVSCVAASMIILEPAILYNPFVEQCFLAKTTPTLTAVWAAPLGWEFSVIILTAYNALSRPRRSEKPLVQILHRDGMMFFVSVTLLRGTMIAFTFINQPGLVTFPAFFIWAMLLLGLNRMLIHIRSSEQEVEYDDTYPFLTSSPTCQGSADAARCSSIERDSTIELHSYWAK